MSPLPEEAVISPSPKRGLVTRVPRGQPSLDILGLEGRSSLGEERSYRRVGWNEDLDRDAGFDSDSDHSSWVLVQSPSPD